MKTTGVLTALVVAAVLSVNGDPGSNAATRGGTVPAEEITAARSAWTAAFKRLPPEATLADLDRLVGGRVRDRASLPFGGSGNGVVYYLIDDVNQICAFHDLGERVSHVQIEPRGVWLKGPDGTLLRAPTPSGDVVRYVDSQPVR